MAADCEAEVCYYSRVLKSTLCGVRECMYVCVYVCVCVRVNYVRACMYVRVCMCLWCVCLL